MSFTIANIYPPQFVPDTTAAKLQFSATLPLIGGLSVVPGAVAVLLTSLLVNNVTAGVVTLKLYRGNVADAQHIMTGFVALNIPPATISNPWFQALSAPIVLQPGDSIWGLAGTASGLNITGDGEIITQ